MDESSTVAVFPYYLRSLFIWIPKQNQSKAM
ncbi:hypothetical protein BPC006_II0928 [Burkholderia pseudomallei BPC006]|nr:hypothetical protein BPC006_II0928 [Burkholderia pseudomallei BPC006]